MQPTSLAYGHFHNIAVNSGQTLLGNYSNTRVYSDFPFFSTIQKRAIKNLNLLFIHQIQGYLMSMEDFVGY